MDTKTETEWRAELAGRDALIAKLKAALDVAAFYLPQHGAAKDEANWAIVAKARKAVPIPTVDLGQEFWRQIQRAAAESTWIPPDYMMNDWVADVCAFLRQPHPGLTSKEDDAVVARLRARLDACVPSGAHHAVPAVDHIRLLRLQLQIADRDLKLAVGAGIGDDAYVSVLHDLLREFLSYAESSMNAETAGTRLATLRRRLEELRIVAEAHDPRGDAAGNIMEDEDTHRHDPAHESQRKDE